MPVKSAQPPISRSDPGSVLACQIRALAGDRADVTIQRERPWASITFSGTRHSFSIGWTGNTDGVAMRTLADALSDHEFDVPAYFIADVLVTEQSAARLLVEVLSIVDPVSQAEL